MMKRHSVVVLPVVALGLGLLASACGSSSNSPAGPTAPSVTTRGATIQGTVETAPGASGAAGAVRSLAVGAGIRVSVTGTSLSTTTDGQGKFVLAGVPAGTKVEIRFEAPGIDARLQVSELSEGQSISISIRLSGTQAVLTGTDDNKNEVNLTGVIEAITGTTLQVAGKRVLTDGATQFLGRDNAPAALKDFKVGDTVEVEGTTQADGSVYARKLKREDAGEPENEVSFRGTIQGVNPLVVAGRKVVTDGSTRILDKRDSVIPLSALKVGDTVEVEGTTQADGSVLAKKIKLDD